MLAPQDRALLAKRVSISSHNLVTYRDYPQGTIIGGGLRRGHGVTNGLGVNKKMTQPNYPNS